MDLPFELTLNTFSLSAGALAGVGASALLGFGLYKLNLGPKLQWLQRKSNELQTNLDLLQASVNTGIEALLLWPPNSTEELASDQLHEILAIPALIRKVGFIDVLNLFEGSARTELDLAVHGLRVNGTGFRLTLTSNRLKRSFSILGVRLLTEKGGNMGDALRIRDRTDEFNEISKLNFEAKTSSSEARRLREVFDALPIPIWQRSQDLNISFANKAYKQAVEGDPTLPGPKKYEIGAGALGADGRSLAQKAVSFLKGQSERHPIVIAGSRKLMEINEIPIPGSVEGTIASIAGCALDYSTVEQAKKELARQEKAQGELLESLETAIVIFGTDKRLNFFNTSFAELMKMEATWLDTKPDISELMEALRERRLLPEVANFPDFKRGWNDLFTSLLEAKDELLHLPNGRTIRLLITPHPLGGLIFIFDDVTDRIRLQESHSMLSAVQKETIDNLYEAIVVFGEDGKLKLYNPAFAKLWNLKEDILNKEPHISEILELTKPYFAGNTGGEFKQLMIDCWSNRRAQSGRLERTDQSVVDYSVVPLPDGGSLFGYVDITDSFRVERALIERTEALEAADQLKSEFIANVSYGLRAPLTSIIGFAEILENNYFGKLNDKQHEYSQGILDASQKLHALINDILDLATIEAGYMDLQYTTFDVHVMLASIINLVRDRAASHGLNIDFECPMSIGSMSADERRLRQILLNLIGNAINFTPPGGKIVIKGERVKNEIWMVVADTGQGITPEEQANVFEKFKRGNTKKAGAGLGLSLVKSFIELHGGSVELKSEVGKGTIIICKIPAQPAKQKAA